MDNLTGQVLDDDAALIASAEKLRYSPLVVDHGEGSWLVDPDGRRYLDFSASWSVADLGYSNERVRAAITRQLHQTTYAGLISAVNQPATRLARRLLGLVPGAASRKVWFGHSGTDAADAAQRLILRASPGKRIISFVGSWHGTSDAAAALSGHPSLGRFQAGHIIQLPYPNPYRNPFGASGEEQRRLGDQCLGFIEEYVFPNVCPPENIAAIFVEAIQSDAGVIVPPSDFLPGLRRICDRHHIWLVVDDIKIGLGRTGTMFSFEQAGIAPDFLLLGKALGGGLPLSAVIGPAEVLDIATGIALTTTAGNATCCAGGLALLDALEDDDLLSRVGTIGAHLQQALWGALDGLAIVGDVRGLGLLQGIELINDRESRLPNRRAAAKIVYRCWELGLNLYYVGNAGNVLEITPPLIITRDEIDFGVSILAQAIGDVIDGKVSDNQVAQFAGW